MGERVFKAVGALLAVGAGLVTQKVISASWRIITNTPPPENPEDPDTSLAEAASWALASGVTVGLVQLLTARQWTKYYINATGHRPGEKPPKEVVA